VQGFSESDNQDILGRRFAFVTRAKSFTQLTGRHTLRDHRRLRLEWEGNLAFIQRDEPDTRDIQFDLLEDGRRRFQTGPGSGEHFFSRLDDTTGGLGACAALPLADVELTVGAPGCGRSANSPPAASASTWSAEFPTWCSSIPRRC
jgi:hypothetical protein